MDIQKREGDGQRRQEETRGRKKKKKRQKKRKLIEVTRGEQRPLQW